MSELYLYNTLSRKKEKFIPKNPEKVTLYVCGITPYDYTHLGHARTYCAFDILKRYLIYRGFRVFHIQNITDIDDKIVNRAREENRDWKELSEHFSKLGHSDLEKINILKPDSIRKVTEHIPEIISMIEKILENKHAYITKTGVYFSIETFEPYGSLSNQTTEKMKAGARVEVDETKKNPLDFALWKFSKPNEPSWDSPWGKGRPGWHIECSVLSTLKEELPLDIHGGGFDLIFPHHENEIAQTEACYGKKFVNYWLHAGFLTIKGEKMAKSLGNYITINELLKRHSPASLRLFFAKTHYRSQIDFSYDILDDCENALNNIQNAVENCNYLIESGKFSIDAQDTTPTENMKKFQSAMDDDLNTPVATSIMFEHVDYLRKITNSKNGNFFSALSVLNQMLWILGIPTEKKTPCNITEEPILRILLSVRESLREQKNFELSDKIRKELELIGIELRDSKEGTQPVWKK